MQLLKITRVPIQVQYEVEPAKLEAQRYQKPKGNIDKQEPKLEIRKKDIQVNLSTKQSFASMGIQDHSTRAMQARNRGVQKAQQGVSDTVELGNNLANIAGGATINGTVQHQNMSNYRTTEMTFIPSVGPDISWDPAEIDMNYEAGDVNINWELMSNSMTYVPGKFSLNITQYPKVNIEYVGGFQYVPPSADPNHEEE